MNNPYLLSVMLIGLVSLFTLCVDVDYYDLYEDEEEILSPLSKRGKDSFGSQINPYEFMRQSTFLEGECAATCYQNMKGGSAYAARQAIIMQLYGFVDSETIMLYYASVQRMQDITPTGEVLNRAFESEGMTASETSELSDYFEEYKTISEKVAIKVEGHVGIIGDMECLLDATRKVYRIQIKDNYPNGDKRPKDKKEYYQIVVDRATGRFLGSDIQAVWF